MRIPLALLLISSLALLSGCGDSSESDSGEEEASTSVASSDGVKQVKLDALPKLGDEMPEQETAGLRITMRAPKEWNIVSRGKDLARFTKDKGGQFPRLVLTTAEPVITGYTDVNTENVAAFAEAINTWLEEKYPGEKYANNVDEPARPLILGNNAYARYVKIAALNNRAVDVQVLATIRNGRYFTVELSVEKGTILANRDTAYSFAGHLKFESSGAASTELPAEPAKTESAKTAEPAEKTEEKAQ